MRTFGLFDMHCPFLLFVINILITEHLFSLQTVTGQLTGDLSTDDSKE